MRAALADGIVRMTEGLVELLGELDGRLGRLLDVVDGSDREELERIVAEDATVDERVRALNEAALVLIATQAPVAGDLRRVGAGLHQLRAVERVGDQLSNVAKLVLSADEAGRPSQRVVDGLREMGGYAREQLTQTRHAIQLWDAETAVALRDADTRINFLQRTVFEDAVDAARDGAKLEWAMHGVLMARALERVGDLSVHIGEQTVYAIRGEILPAREPWSLD